MRTDLELAHALGSHWRRARQLSEFFRKFNIGVTDNARIIVAQAQDYVAALAAAEREPEHADALKAHARTELSRVLTVALRECFIHGWALTELLEEGIEYEWSVKGDVESGRRRPRSTRGLQEADAEAEGNA